MCRISIVGGTTTIITATLKATVSTLRPAILLSSPPKGPPGRTSRQQWRGRCPSALLSSERIYVFGLFATQIPTPWGLTPTTQCWPCGQDLWSILLIEQCLTAAAVGSDETAKTVNAAKIVAILRSVSVIVYLPRLPVLPTA